MTCVQLVPPSALLTIDEAKRQVRRTDDNDDDLYLTSLIAVVQGQIDAGSPLGRSIMPQTWELRLDGWQTGKSPCSADTTAVAGITLPYPPIVSVDSVTYLDQTGARQTLTGYRLGGDIVNAPQLLPPQEGWPSLLSPGGGVRIRFTAGYVATDDNGEPRRDRDSKLVAAPPPMLKHAALLLLAHLYEYRAASVPVGAATTLPMGFAALMDPYRVWGH